MDGTAFDFRAGRPIDHDLDHGWLLDPAAAPAARLTASDGKLTLELHTTMPALQVYTGAHLAGAPGRTAAPMVRNAGVALEPGWLADSPNQTTWPQRDCWCGPQHPRIEHTRWHWST